MDNLIFLTATKHQLPIGIPLHTHYDHTTKTIIILTNESIIHFLTHNSKENTIELKNSTSPLQEIEGKNIILFEYLVDSEQVLIFTENGSILTVNEDGLVDIKAENQEGIAGGSVSPTQEYIYVVTNNTTLIQLNMEFDLVKEIPLDDHATEKSESYCPNFSWKADGSFFSINIQTDVGRKCHTRDEMLGIFRSPSLSDPDPEGLVQSVSEKSRQSMSKLVAYQPNGGLIAGSDYINFNGKKINRVIFWQKNSLRHLQFNLPDNVTQILNLTWSQDSKILLTEILLKNSTRWLYFYYRCNYHWYLKQTLQIDSNYTTYLFPKHKNNSLLLVTPNSIQIFQLELKLNTNIHTNYEINHHVLYASIDGNCLKVTNFANGLIPPPMCHKQLKFQHNIHGVDVKHNYIVIFTEEFLEIYDYQNQKRNIISLQNYQHLKRVISHFKVLRIDSQDNKIIISVFGKECSAQFYQILLNQEENNKKIQLLKEQYQNKEYYIIEDNIHNNNNIDDQPNEKDLKIEVNQLQLINEQLLLNGNKLTNHCTSFILYHQFLAFTCSTSDMYDRLFVFDLTLDSWIIEDFVEQKMKMKIEEAVEKKLLNFRVIERGGRIIGCSKNRIIFTLPRGNLQAIFPKVFMIKHVQKCMLHHKFQQAFETIRTHKLDLNLLYDLNPRNFTENSQSILTGFAKPDYLNLFISQLKDSISTQLQYCLTPSKIDQNKAYISLKLNQQKINEVCSIVSETLRKNNYSYYILSIFTSEIKMGKLNNVLFEIKEMKENKNEHDEQIPPHMASKQKKNTKTINSQQILEYVCWLVDANVIYQASLLTYDLELAAMTARFTQMDPKEYIPYLETLKQINNKFELKKKICMDLKKYDKVVEQLSLSSMQEHKQFTLQLIQKYKLFKCGLIGYKNDKIYLKQIKLLLINQLLQLGELNQAYNLCVSIPDFQKGLQIAIKLAQGEKIIQILENHFHNNKKQKALQFLAQLGQQGFKNKNQFAHMLVYVGDYDQAVKCYLTMRNYQMAFKYLNKVSEDLRNGTQIQQQMKLIFSLHKNLLLKEKSQILEKVERLAKVHKAKSLQGEIFTPKNRQNDDMYSQISLSSKASSSYTISTTTGLRKKKDKKKSILNRNVKQGSLLQQQYLVVFLHDIKSRIDTQIRQTKLLIQHLIYFNLIAEAEILRDIGNQYAKIGKNCTPKYYAQVQFEADHPEFAELIEVYENPKGEQKDKQKAKKPAIQSFNYLF